MKLLAIAAAALVGVSAMTVTAAPAEARGWHTKKVCKTVIRHGHRTRVCRTVRQRR